jgi:plasmid stabilization system protein ParE
MASVEFSATVPDDLDRIFDHLARWDVANAPERIAEILKAFRILESNPLIGRPTRDGKRELVIGRDARGSVAEYRYRAAGDVVVILHIRSQREAGYKD